MTEPGRFSTDAEWADFERRFREASEREEARRQHVQRQLDDLAQRLAAVERSPRDPDGMGWGMFAAGVAFVLVPVGLVVGLALAWRMS